MVNPLYNFIARLASAQLSYAPPSAETELVDDPVDELIDPFNTASDDRASRVTKQSAPAQTPKLGEVAFDDGPLTSDELMQELKAIADGLSQKNLSKEDAERLGNRLTDLLEKDIDSKVLEGAAEQIDQLPGNKLGNTADYIRNALKGPSLGETAEEIANKADQLRADPGVLEYVTQLAKARRFEKYWQESIKRRESTIVDALLYMIKGLADARKLSESVRNT